MIRIILATIFASAACCSASQITSDQFLTGTLGSPFSYQITADNQPVSFDVVDLKPGLTLDRTTGLISGVPTISGPNNYFQVIAHGTGGDAQASCSLFVYRPVPLPDSVQWTSPDRFEQIVGDPKRPRLYCLANDALVVIDTNTRERLKLFDLDESAHRINVSPDGRTLLISRTRLANSVALLDLELLDHLVDVPTSNVVFFPQEGLDDRLYVADGQEVLQLNSQSGAIEQRFTPGVQSAIGPMLAISPDRKTLYVARVYRPDNTLVTKVALFRYDVSSSVPVFLQQVELPASEISEIIPDPTGDWVFLRLGTFDGFGSGAIHQTMCVSAHDLEEVRGMLSFHGTSNGLSFAPDGRTIVQSRELSDGGFWMTGLVDFFDAQTFQLSKSIVLGNNFSLGGSPSYGIWGAAMAPDEKSLFVGTSTDLRMYNTEPPPAKPTPPKSFLNISTRLPTEDSDNVLIGGFIVTGSETKEIMVRGIGTSLPISKKLTDPVLELHRSDGILVTTNDNWNSKRQDVLATGIPPLEDREAAIVVSLEPGAYTAILKGAGGSSGIGVIEIYDLSPSITSRLANISTRGRVQTGDNVMIGGWIIGGDEITRVAVRALGPSLAMNGVSNVLPDPILEVHDGNGGLLAQNDDWGSEQQALLDSGLALSDSREAGLVLSLPPGNYTAVVRGKGDSTGVGLLEVYNLL